LKSGSSLSTEDRAKTPARTDARTAMTVIGSVKRGAELARIGITISHSVRRAGEGMEHPRQNGGGSGHVQHRNPSGRYGTWIIQGGVPAPLPDWVMQMVRPSWRPCQYVRRRDLLGS
jgi:hypothetical protein